MQDPEGIAFWPDHESRDNARTPMPWRADAPHAGFSSGRPWLPVEPRHLPLAVDRQEADPDSPLAFTRRFLAWRKGHRALAVGDIRFLAAEDRVLAFERRYADERILCAFNLSGSPAQVRIDGAGGARVLEGSGLAGTLAAGVADLPAHGAVFARMP